MSNILVLVEVVNGIINKSSVEALAYAKSWADNDTLEIYALGYSLEDTTPINNHNIRQYIAINTDDSYCFDSRTYATQCQTIIDKYNIDHIVYAPTNQSKSVAGYLAAFYDSSCHANVTTLPEKKEQQWEFRRGCYSNRAETLVCVSDDKKLIIGVARNLYKPSPDNLEAKTTEIETIPAVNSEHIQLVNRHKNEAKVSIADAKIVVSGGKGLKDPSNWWMIEKLAEVLGGATACTKAVSDLGWRPHAEHVGQTGKPVSSDIYIAIGISGAVQHLAGVNASKTKIVINIDPEAVFFKHADYGIVADALEVIPTLIENLEQRLSN